MGPVHEGSGGRHGRRDCPARRSWDSPRGGPPQRRFQSANTADAHADLVDLDVDLLSLDLAGVQVGHSRSAVASTTADGTSTALLGRSRGLPRRHRPPARRREACLRAPVPGPAGGRAARRRPVPVIDVGSDRGRHAVRVVRPEHLRPGRPVGGPGAVPDRHSTWARPVGSTLASLPGIGALADVKASETSTRTFLDDNGARGSDVVSRATTTVGDITLLGGEVTVDVTSPVVLEARSDGTDGSAGYVNPPTVVATVAGQPITLPADGQPQPITLPLVLDTLVDLTLTAYPAEDQSTDPTGRATVDAPPRVDLEVLDVGVLDAAYVSLAIAPMSVEATAPAGGVECGAGYADVPAAPVIESPADGGLVDDATPAVSARGTRLDGRRARTPPALRSARTWPTPPRTPGAAHPRSPCPTGNRP